MKFSLSKYFKKITKHQKINISLLSLIELKSTVNGEIPGKTDPDLNFLCLKKNFNSFHRTT